MSEQHTPEPWVLSDYYSDCLTITDKDGFEMVSAKGNAILQGYAEKLGVNHWADNPKSYRELSENEQHANARRIVACVNALVGWETSTVEKYCTDGTPGNPNLGQAFAAIKAQRDKLLAALEAEKKDAERTVTELLAELLRVRQICLREVGVGIVDEVVIANVKGGAYKERIASVKGGEA